MARCDYELLQGPRCSAEAGHAGSHRYKCAGVNCPGLTYPAHVLAHPASCVEEPPSAVDDLAGAVTSHQEAVRLRDLEDHIDAELRRRQEMADAIERGDYELAAGEGRKALDAGDPLELAATVDRIAGAAIERHRRRFTIGARVKTLRGFSGVPIGTAGVVDEHYTAGVMVAWDLEDRPLRPDYAELIRGGLRPLPQAALGAPLRDGFSYGDLVYLEVLEERQGATEELSHA